MLRECSPPYTCHISCVTCHVSHVICHVSRVMCHMSRDMCHISRVMCHMSRIQYHIGFFLSFSDKVVKLVGGACVINGDYPVWFLTQTLSYMEFKSCLEGKILPNVHTSCFLWSNNFQNLWIISIRICRYYSILGKLTMKQCFKKNNKKNGKIPKFFNFSLMSLKFITLMLSEGPEE